MSIAKEQLRIIFMGTPEFAVHILDGLVQQNYNVVGVITRWTRRSYQWKKKTFNGRSWSRTRSNKQPR